MLTLGSLLFYDPDYRHNSWHVYNKDDVLRWRDMVEKNVTLPHEFICLTDQPDAFEGTGITAFELDRRVCFPNRLFQQVAWFDPEWAEHGIERLATFDLDLVVTGNLDEILDRPEPLVLWRNPARWPWDNPKYGPTRALYNTSLMLIDTEAMARFGLWNFFMSATGPIMERYRAAQEFISGTIGPEVAYWDGSHGIYRPARYDTPGCGIEAGQPLPENCRLVFWPGEERKPWRAEIQKQYPWVPDYFPWVDAEAA